MHEWFPGVPSSSVYAQANQQLYSFGLACSCFQSKRASSQMDLAPGGWGGGGGQLLGMVCVHETEILWKEKFASPTSDAERTEE